MRIDFPEADFRFHGKSIARTEGGLPRRKGEGAANQSPVSLFPGFGLGPGPLVRVTRREGEGLGIERNRRILAVRLNSPVPPRKEAASIMASFHAPDSPTRGLPIIGHYVM